MSHIVEFSYQLLQISFFLAASIFFLIIFFSGLDFLKSKIDAHYELKFEKRLNENQVSKSITEPSDN